MMKQLNTCIVDRQIVEVALLKHPLIDDCVVLVRKAETSRPELVAYIVFAGSFSLEKVQSHLRSCLSAVMMPIAYIPVSTLPLTELGQVDEQALIDLEAIDSDLVQRWEERLQSVPQVEQVAVIVEDYNEKIPPLHLSDLLPEKSRPVNNLNLEKSVELPASSQAAALLQKSESKALAISYGAARKSQASHPSTLSAVLLRTALQIPSEGILYLKADGSEIVQSYKALLNEAEQILAGLRQLGLKPQDKVIFQINQNWDFIPAFWGCILGGFVPVPISTASIYESANSTVQKLHNAWQMLEQPLILTTTELAPAVRSLSNLFGLENFQVETVDRLRLCDKDENWHVSQPDDLAILILTSGSTGTPKGVMLQHRNIISSVAGTSQMNNLTSLDISLNWLPLDHPGPLIRCVIRCVFLGCQQIHAPTEAVLQDILKWLDLCDRYRVTTTWAPNFAFALLCDRANDIEKRHWDLSEIRSFLNTAEPIAPQTARKVLKLLSPHGLSANAMHSSWGMAETSSGVTFSEKYLQDSSIPEYATFVELGSPIPGISLRIVNENQEVVNEQTIGYLQVKGSTVTSGYYQNPEMNREVFTEDGWFNTGDLGFLYNGCLTVTGRIKNIIIINGVNYYSHEIEEVVEAVEGVEISYTAACATRQPGSNTDELIVFFHTSISEDERLVELLKKIRKNVVSKIGIRPDYFIPVQKEAIPKTSIGKIQHAQLKKSFETGEFDAIVKRVDILFGNNNTVPDWFYRQIWRRKETAALDIKPKTGLTLVFLDSLGLGEFLCAELGKLNQPWVGVEAGSDFAKLADNRYRIAPQNPDHYRQLVESVSKELLPITQILHLWTYDEYAGEILDLEALEQAQQRGVYSLLFLVQALERFEGSDTLVRLSVIASLSQATSKDEKIACERSPILGVIKTIPQELPWLDCRHLDLPVQQSEVNATHIMHELQVIDKEQEVAYRNGQRLVPRIEKVDFTKEEKRDLPFKEGGMYLVTGGLGGIGSEIAKYLLKHYNARLLLVGRTPLPERSTWDHLEKGDTVRERIKTYLSLEQLSGAIAYEAVDICNLSQLQQVVDRVCHSCQCELDGVIHLAGTIETRLLLEETADSFAATLRPKVGGTWVLHKLIENQPESVFISFSSVNGFFGRMTAGAYAAANRFLDSFSQHQQNLSSLHYCFAWSMWDETGLSRNYQMKDLNRARGYSIISQEQGLHSFLAGLHREPGYLLVGLDGSKQYIQHQREMEAHSSQKLCAYFTAKTALPVERLEKLSVRDRFGTQSNSDFVQLEEMPLLATGEIDREQLISIKRGNSQASGDQVVPRNELERQIASIWHQVLNIPQVGIHDNFFELGGHSLLAMQVIYRVRQGFSTEIPLGLLFETPTIASLAQAIAQSQNQGTDTSKHQAIAKRTNKESTPLSFAQQRLWFLDQLEPDSAAYHIIKGVQLQGDLNVAVLQQTLDAIVAHHEALRTNFVTHDGNPVQVISEPRSVELVMIDLKDCPETERTTQVEQLLQQQAQRPFNLTKDLMLRACLVQLSPQEHILLLVMHHIASDGWSISILFEQLTTLYQAFLNGLPNPLPELPIQYADFAQWQRQWLSGEVLENQLNYWKQQLVDATPVLELPTDQPRPAVQTYQGAKQSFVIPQSLSTSLSALSRTEGVTLFMILLAAFQTLLYRYTGQEDILVGSPIAGRNWEEIEGLIGFFVNTLVLRTDVSGNSSFRELLQRVGAVAMSAYAHQDLPFEKLVEELQPERSLSYHPIFQIMFVLQNTPKQTLDLPGLTLTPFDLDNVTSMFDLTLSMKETEQGLQGFWEYNTDLFDAATITRMTGHFQTLLDGIVANPQQHISELPLLTAAERQQLLVQWNNTQADYQKDTCLHQLIEVQVEKTPDAIAIVFEDQQLTYRELNTRANQLAHYLQSLGIGPDVLVGICVERSLEMVIGLLGILKAGGAYVPLDPGYPQERLAYMLEDSQVAVLLTQQRLMVSVPQHSAQVVLLDADWEDIAQERQENPISGAKADNFAYVIYTSGTTGKPKGVLVNHSNVVRLFKATEAWYKFNEHDVWTLFHSYAFDFSVWELWGALLYGGRVVVVSYYVSRSPEDFYNLLRYEQVTVLNQTPSAFRQLIRVDEFSGTAKKLNLRLVIFGGEALELQSLKPWFERHGDQFPQLVNMYGITETTVHVTYRPLTVDDLNTKGSVIGSPIPDLKLYILDQNLQPVPIGVPGEMYVGGAGVTQGYLNRPELTDERFIPNRFSTNPEERLYKTGDLARYLLDGDIEYLGRIDHQVKIRGFRIEIGEIEAVLAQHPEVREVVVLAREDSPGDKRLVAYVVPNQESVFTPTELRHFLKEQLPEYMVPSAFVFLEALPLTSNGKLNRRALPAPDGSNQESEATFVAPRDDLEQKLSQIWSEVLGIQPIGVRDNFFDLGGHSLLAVRLFSQIEKNFDKKLPLATLFQSGTVEALANMLRQGQEPAVSNQVLIAAHQQDTSEAPWSSLVKIQPHGSKPPFFCIHPLGGEILCYRPLALQLGSDQPVYGLQPLGLDGKQPLLTRVEDMAAHYIKEIQTIQRNGPYYLGGYSFGGIVAYEMAQQLHSQGEKVGVLAMLDTSVPGSSTRLPFWKRVLVHIDNLLQIGPAYLWKKLVGWREWGKYNLREKYIRLLEVSPLLPKDDKHLDLMGAHTKAFDDYIYQIYPGRMILLRTDDKNRTEAVGDIYDPLFGWGELVAGGVDVYHLPGSHLTFIEEPDVQVLAEKLKGCLEKAYAVNSNRVAKTGDDLVKALTGKYE